MAATATGGAAHVGAVLDDYADSAAVFCNGSQQLGIL